MSTNLVLRVVDVQAGAEAEAGAVHAARHAVELGANLRHLSFGRRLHVTVLAPELDNSPPEVQQVAVVDRQVLVERLQDKDNHRRRDRNFAYVTQYG